MKRNLYKILICIYAILCLTGCSSIKSENKIEKEVTIERVDYNPSWPQTVICGKVTTVIIHPATYNTYVSYNGKEYKLENKETYDYCKELIGEKVVATFLEKNYEDGRQSMKLLEIKKE